MVDGTIHSTRNRSTLNGAGCDLDRAIVLPKVSQPEIEGSSVGVGPVFNDKKSESTGGTASVGLGPPLVRGRRGFGRARL